MGKLSRAFIELIDEVFERNLLLRLDPIAPKLVRDACEIKEFNLLRILSGRLERNV